MWNMTNMSVLLPNLIKVSRTFLSVWLRGSCYQNSALIRFAFTRPSRSQDYSYFMGVSFGKVFSPRRSMLQPLEIFNKSLETTFWARHLQEWFFFKGCLWYHGWQLATFTNSRQWLDSSTFLCSVRIFGQVLYDFEWRVCNQILIIVRSSRLLFYDYRKKCYQRFVATPPKFDGRIADRINIWLISNSSDTIWNIAI